MAFSDEQMEMVSFVEDFPQISALIWRLLHKDKDSTVASASQLLFFSFAVLKTESFEAALLHLTYFTLMAP